MRTTRHLTIGGLVLLGLVGCQGAGHDPLVPSMPDPMPARIALAPGEQLGEVLRIRIDPASLEATLEAAAHRGAVQPPQALSFDLDLTQILRSTNFRVASVTRATPTDDLLVTLRFDHPFPAPNFANAISAGNRADLGFTGRVLLLSDHQAATATIPGEAALTFPTGMIRNPDGFVAVGDLLYRQGFASNCFPYRLLVNEPENNRLGVDNGGSMTGNYVAATGGWQRGNAGTPATQWTGYDYIHQGQSATTTFRLEWADLAASDFTFAIALLAKYTDPRGIPGPESRFPYEPVDVTKFAYRLPYAALDASQCSWCNTLELPGPPLEKTLNIALRDWDTGADEAADADLSDETDVALVQPGAGAAPTVELIAPALSPAPIAFTLDAGSGLPGDELAYSLTLRNDAGAEGEAWCLIRARDPEWSDASFDEYHFGVDPVTLAGDPARAIRPATYMPLRIHTWPSDSWLTTLTGTNQSTGHLSTTPAGTLLGAMSWSSSDADGDPAPCVQPLPYAGGSRPDVGLVELSTAGQLLRQWAWESPTWQRSLLSAAAEDGSVFIAFSVENEAGDYSDTTIDLDPGPGTSTFAVSRTGIAIVKLAASGQYAWGGVFDRVYYVGTNHQFAGDPIGLQPLPGGGVAVTGWYFREVDLDPTAAGTEPVLATNGVEWFISVLDASGQYLWGHSSNGQNRDFCSAPRLKANGNLVLTGQFRQTVDFEPGPGTTNLSSLGQFSGFRAEYTPSGGLAAAVGWGVATGDNSAARYIHVGSQDQEYIVGSFTGANVDFDPGPGTNAFTTQLPVGNWTYISRFAADGTYEWTRVIETLSQPMGLSQSSPLYLAMSDTDQLYLWCSYIESVLLDLDPGPGVVTPAQPSPYTGCWLRLDADGEYVWHHVVPSDAFNFYFGGMTVAPGNRLVLSLSADQPQDLDPSPATHSPGFVAETFRAAFVQFQPDGTF